MAKPGTYSAYQQLRPIQEDFGDIMRGAEVMDAQRKQQEAAKKAAKQKAEADRLADIAEQEGLDMEAITDPGTSGYDGMDEAAVGFAHIAEDTLANFYQNLRRAGRDVNNLSAQETIYKNNILNSAKILSESQKAIYEYSTGLKEGIEDGTLSGYNAKTIEFLDKYYNNEDGQIIPTINKRGEAVFVWKGKDGEMETLNASQIVKGTGLAEKVAKTDLQEWTKGLNLADKVSNIEKEGVRTKSQTYAAVKDGVDAAIQGWVGAKDNPKNEARSVWVDHMGNDPKADLTEDDMQQIYDFVEGQVENQYKTIYEQIETDGGDNDDDKDRTKLVLTTTSGVPTKTNVSDIADVKTFAGYDRIKDMYAYSFGIPEVEMNTGKGKRYVNQLYLTENGDILYRRTEKKGSLTVRGEGMSYNQGIVSEEVENGILDPNEIASLVANMDGYESVNELMESMIKKLEDNGVSLDGTVLKKLRGLGDGEEAEEPKKPTKKKKKFNG